MVETPFLQQPEKKSTTLMNDCLLMDEGFTTKLFLRLPNTKKELFFIAMHTQMARRAHPCFKKVKNSYMQLPILLIRYLTFGSNHFNGRNFFI